MKAARRPLKRPNMRRAVILFPSGFTLGNLFFGVFAIIAASRLEFTTAGVYVMLGGICDALDGRVARATNSGTQFGEELDSLVDAVTFGLAPAMIMYFAVLNRDGWDWIFVFLFCACAVLRLARFNIEQAGTAKTYFQGLPSPAAGITLASYYWFSQSWLYSYGAIGDLPWHKLLRFIMAGLAMLMISNVPYPNFPRTGFRSIKAALASLLLVTCAILFFWVHRLEFFFPLALAYVAWGLFRWVFFGLFERRQPTVPYDLSEGEDEEDEEEYEVVSVAAPPPERGHRRAEATTAAERPRGRTDRGAREGKSPREPRETGETGETAETRDVRPPRGDGGDRQPRAEEDRAGRREKRDRKVAGRGVRPAADAAAPAALALTPAAPALPSHDEVAASGADGRGAESLPDGDEQIIGTIPGGAEGDADAVNAAGGAPRKRKRRRRRGSRDRAEGGQTDPAGRDDVGAPDDARVAGTADASEPRPYVPPLPAPSPSPSPSPVSFESDS